MGNRNLPGRKAFWCFFLTAWLTAGAFAHEMRPAYLQVDQITETTYQVIWKIPRRGEMVIRLQPVFPGADALLNTSVPKPVDGAMLYSFELKSGQPLPGQQVYIDGLERTMVDVLVTVSYLNGDKGSFMLKPDANLGNFPETADKLSIVRAYTLLGIEHILFGMDHLLFVLALIIITRGFGKIIRTITAFTIAHSITLSLAVLGIVQFPGPPIEAVIALSILFLATEILKVQQGSETLTSRKPWLVAFTFGLLHGLGFAGALAEVGLPQNEIPLALAFFNIGVELGQIAFVLAVVLAMRLLAVKISWPVLLKKAPTYAIGSLAAFWLIERIVAF
ncbi:HupE/UreJ family protein [Robiginitalea sp. SC105]|uniref:HupE/UreJ family protein n=1 Tax=Robiginitalea sp. SC105 TaxID=2762332 RepID=UPI001639C397|nr:HupE/UreJ family protein [Robiginitalea sp. SC105]MBC2838860.1 HupE/UreJ family protein [Robiginitalea sp. SC105]